ncbi:Pleiotropic drug resistance protein abc superfamily [Globisporangium polare]
MTAGPGEPETQPSPASAAAAGITYTTGHDMMAHGPQALHEDIAAKVEVALGKSFPHMEVRFKHVSLSADLVMAHDPHHHHHHHRHKNEGDDDDDDGLNDTNDQSELPTLPNHVMKTIAKVATKKHTVTRHILKNVTGTFKPGTLTLILGQSGSGKSALMKLLSGRFPIDKEINVEGEITYNGMSREKLLKRLPQFVAYVTQHDKHFPTLTTRETLEFAHECCGATLPERAVKFLSHGTDEENAIAIEAARSVYRHYPDIVVQELGLEQCQYTLVGNAMVRGISGGERKRVTTGEMEFGMKYVVLMDEISTGLDSAAAFDIINTQRSIAKKLHKTVIISLLQPSPEVFALFDNVMILNEGEVMYHGSCAEVVAYFETLGFVCPPRRDIADFLCDLGTNQQVQYQTGGGSPLSNSLLGNGSGRHPRLASEFAELFMQSSIYKVMEQDIEEPYDPVLISDAVAHMDPIPEFQQSFWASTWTLMKRQTKLQLRNTAFLKGRAMLVVIMGLVYGSVFYQIDLANIQVAIGVIFASILFLGLGQSSMLTTFYNSREVFYKQRAANFYRTSSYVLSNSASHIPFAIAESLIFGSMIYWMGDFVQEAGAFILFEVFLVLSILVFLAWFFLLAAVAPNLHIAKPMAMVSLLIFILFAGFVVTKDQIPDYMIWIYWLNPIAWTLRSMVVAQYRHSSLDKCVYKDFDYCTTYGGRTMGMYSLALFDVPSEKGWIVYGAIFMVCAYFLFMFIAYVVLEFHRYERPENISLPNEALALEATGVSPASSGDEGTTTDDAYALVKTPRSNDVVLRVESQRERKITPVTVAFQDLWYTVSVPAGNGQPAQSLDLLKGITGYALPGSMTALMGSSGAGKTTLMDVIAGRKTGGTIKGKILLNGWEASDLAVRRCTGYCEQMDIHSEAATFREALTFSAFLRQGADVHDSHKYDSVSECLELLAMEDIADHIIRGSSTEQMKRLTIGVELAAQPSVLFLDEPTSGLDARSAKVIMDGVRKVADSGRTILCTIHQPSSEVFQLFDSLLLLKRGGETVFFGDLGHEGSELIKYFEAIPGTPRIANGYNPATWMLEVIGAGVGRADVAAEGSDADASQSVNFVEHFAASENKRVLIDSKLQEPGLFQPLESLQPVTFSNKRAATELVQLKFLMKRFFNMYWRTPSYNWTRLVISLFLGVLFGLVYLNSEYTTYQGINGGLGMIFLATAFIGIVSLISILPIAFEERASFYRERASQTYNAFWYFVCFTVVEIPYVAVGALLFTATFYPMVGFTGFKEFVFYWLNTALQVLFQAYMGQFLIFALPSIEVAAVIGVLFNSIFFLFMGFNPPAIEIPSGYKWLYAITPQRYSFSLLAGTVFGDCSDEHLLQMSVAAKTKTALDMSGWPLGCQLVQNAPANIGKIPIKSYLDHVFGIKHHHLAQYFWIFLAMLVLFRVLAAFAMRYINHQKR